MFTPGLREMWLARMAESGDSSADITIIAIIWNEDYAKDIFYPEIVYHFKDNDGNNWNIRLTCYRCQWYKGPWYGELCRCDENWEIISDSPDNISDLL